MRKQSPHHRARPSPRPLHLEVLEDRCLLSGYAVIDLGPGQAFGINAADQVVGDDAATGHAFLWDPATGLQDLGTLGGRASGGFAINDLGQVVGGSQPGIGPSHAFLWDSVTGMRDLGGLGGPNSNAFDINNAGQVVGSSDLPGDTSYHAFFWQDGVMTDLATLGGRSSEAYGINDAGLVAGADDFGEGASHAWVWDSENGLQDLGTFGLPESVATAVNNVGQVTGWAFSDRDTLAFLWQDGKITELGTFQAKGLNDSGQVVGNGTVEHQTHGVLYTDGVVTDLNDLIDSGSGLTIFEGHAINNAGWIAADARDVLGHFHAVVLIPDDGLAPRGAEHGAFRMLAPVLDADHIRLIANELPASTLREPAPVETVAVLPASATVRRATDAVFAISYQTQPEASRISDGGEWTLEQFLGAGLILAI
jgi:probable HAF family extracellular repeat protein